MKAKTIKFVLLLLITIGILSCKKEETTTSGKSYVKFTLDGTPYYYDFNVADMGTSGRVLDGNRILVTGVKQGPPISQISIDIEDITPSVGASFDLTAAPIITLLYIPDLTAPTNVLTIGDEDVTSGTLSITKMKAIGGGDYAINGSFSGVAVDNDGAKHTITNGEFYDASTE